DLAPEEADLTEQLELPIAERQRAYADGLPSVAFHFRADVVHLAEVDVAHLGAPVLVELVATEDFHRRVLVIGFLDVGLTDAAADVPVAFSLRLRHGERRQAERRRAEHAQRYMFHLHTYSFRGRANRAGMRL